MAIGLAAALAEATLLAAELLATELLATELLAVELIAETLAMDHHWGRNRRQRKSELSYCGCSTAKGTVLKEKESLAEGNCRCLG
jgi:hypothetical protein